MPPGMRCAKIHQLRKLAAPANEQEDPVDISYFSNAWFFSAFGAFRLVSNFYLELRMLLALLPPLYSNEKKRGPLLWHLTK